MPGSPLHILVGNCGRLETVAYRTRYSMESMQKVLVQISSEAFDDAQPISITGAPHLAVAIVISDGQSEAGSNDLALGSISFVPARKMADFHSLYKERPPPKALGQTLPSTTLRIRTSVCNISTRNRMTSNINPSGLHLASLQTPVLILHTADLIISEHVVVQGHKGPVVVQHRK